MPILKVGCAEGKWKHVKIKGKKSQAWQLKPRILALRRLTGTPLQVQDQPWLHSEFHVGLREGRVTKSGEERGEQGRRGKEWRGEPHVFPPPDQKEQKP